MKLLLMMAMIREEPQIVMVRFQSGHQYEIWDRFELLPYNDLNYLVQLCIRVEHSTEKS